MKNATLAAPVLLCLLAAPSAAQELGVMKFPEGEVQHVVRAEDTPWKPCPETLPPGCEMAVLEGNPQAADLFTVRFRALGTFVMPPHWHPKDERVTVINGSVAVAFGAETAREDATEFGPGDYYVNARDAVGRSGAGDGIAARANRVAPGGVIPGALGAGRAEALQRVRAPSNTNPATPIQPNTVSA